MNLILIILAIIFLIGIIRTGLNSVCNSLDHLTKKLDNNEIPNTPFWTAAKETYDKNRVDK